MVDDGCSRRRDIARGDIARGDIARVCEAAKRKGEDKVNNGCSNDSGVA